MFRIRVAKATGASTGVVVTYVDSKGPSAGALVVGDVVESINGTPLETPTHWKARAVKLTAGEPVSLRVRRNREVRELTLNASPSHALPWRESRSHAGSAWSDWNGEDGDGAGGGEWMVPHAAIRE